MAYQLAVMVAPGSWRPALKNGAALAGRISRLPSLGVDAAALRLAIDLESGEIKGQVAFPPRPTNSSHHHAQDSSGLRGHIYHGICHLHSRRRAAAQNWRHRSRYVACD